MSSCLARSFSTARITLSRAASHRVLIPPTSHFNNSASHSIATNIPRHEYKQLPENSNYIEKFYDELRLFSTEFLAKQLNKSYTDFENDPDELVFQVEKFIELQIIPKHSELRESSTVSPMQSVECKTLSDQIVIQRYLDFARGVKKTLMFNGGHTFIFDAMLQAKEVFDSFQTQKAMNK
ncbi:hypothetical protein HG535_0C01840 [Zygotorulaspora mrakii]|uniref:Protein FMP23, mitochondrial n=1 Tax=Zygotorulaspora mrakii TaxID=42260 RepID=A0A7H9AZH5_ZYGMR|nr:uncharacterized protein HG535_0C01840 [Zygotorulaspora mrakii]QLG71835.1 hypothetical protein HG535_0C01840 [Zygotorulaspora mrakii]